jgi:hypothetical protein
MKLRRDEVDRGMKLSMDEVDGGIKLMEDEVEEGGSVECVLGTSRSTS